MIEVTDWFDVDPVSFYWVEEVGELTLAWLTLVGAAVGVAADYGDGIVRLVSDTVQSWDTPTITRRLENAVGKDLQYIRVNGTLVGGLVGLVIHLIDLTLG